MAHLKTPFDGTVARGWEVVAGCFEDSLADGEPGAALCVYADGQCVVDVWGGVADDRTGRRYTDETLQVLSFATNGAAALVALLLVDRGLLHPDRPVADYWPEFAACGKSAISVRDLLAHRAGVPVLQPGPHLADPPDSALTAAMLARQEPLWAPGEAHGYHVHTVALAISELVRRIDGRSLATFFTEEVAGPLGLELWFGLPGDEEWRVAPLRATTGDGSWGIEADSLLWRAATFDGHLLVTSPSVNRRALHAGELPGFGAVGNARSLARMYAAMIGDLDVPRLLSQPTVDLACEVAAEGVDAVLGVPGRYGLGYALHADGFPLSGAGTRMFGQAPVGATRGMADADRGIAIGYATTRVTCGLRDPLAERLVTAVYDCVS
ncbi:MAG TPA: serine hydrolase domain-containing protein [Acidimicrobiales bacterium]|nr:serine hydrolase domain-containing protein [Acidimicrobiales bacterium]